MTKVKRPSFQFYPGDWLRDVELRMVSVGARGLWIDMLCMMHSGTRYGYLEVNLQPILPVNLARMVGATLPEVDGWLKELEGVGSYSVDDRGCIFSRRMIRDEELRQKRAAGGVLGGNPALTGKKAVVGKEKKAKVNQHANLDRPERLNSGATPSSSSSSSSSPSSHSVSYETGAVAPAPIAPSVDNSGDTLIPAPDERWGGDSSAPPPPMDDYFPEPGDYPRDESHGLSDEELSRLRTGTPPPMATPAEQRAADEQGFVPPPGPWPDMETEIWSVGKALMAHYPPAAGPRGGRKDPGQMIGKWLREARDKAIVRDAIWAAVDARTQDPLSFIQRIVGEANHGRGRRQYQGDLRGVDYSHNKGFGIQEEWGAGPGGNP